MIASVRGSVTVVGLDHVVVEVGGVGMLVHTTPADAAALRTGQEAVLATTLVVREDSLTLYGFGEPEQRDLFEQVQTVSGVGPRLALAMLAVHPPDVLRGAITGGEVPTLVKVPGIGKKGAERIILELKDKIAPADAGAAAAGTTPAGPAGVPEHDQVTQALVGLGWSAKQAADAVDTVTGRDPDQQQVSVLLRAALRELGR